LKISKRLSEDVNLRRTDNTMAKIKRTKRQTMVYNYTISTKNRRTPVFWEGKQFLLH
jgi:sRNA-binding regulator protein Hfq